MHVRKKSNTLKRGKSFWRVVLKRETHENIIGKLTKLRSIIERVYCLYRERVIDAVTGSRQITYRA